MRTHKQAAVYQPRREASGESKLADTVILDCQPPELREDKFLLFKFTESAVLVMAAPASELRVQADRHGCGSPHIQAGCC